MKRSTLVAIDNLFQPFFWIFSRLATLFPIKEVNTQQVLIIKFFGMGSITRIATALKTAPNPKEFTLLTLKRNQPVIDLLGLNAIYIDDRNALILTGSLLRKTFTVWRRQFHQVVDMERSSNLAGIFGLTLSLRKRYARFHLGKANYKRGNQHHINLNGKPAIQAIYEILELPLPLSTQDNTNDSTVKSIMININAGDYLPERKFPLNQWLVLAEELNNTFPDSTFYLSGLKKETERVTQFYNRLATRVDTKRLINLSGQLNLPEFAESLKETDLFLTNDSGPLHLAHYFNVKTVAIWGPTSDYLVGYPNSGKMLNLAHHQTCSPCFIGPKSKVAQSCNGELTCFKALQTKTMVEQIKTFVG